MELKIVKRVMQILKATEEAKVTKFYERQVKDFKRKIDMLKHNIKALETELVGKVSVLEDKIEDAKLALDEAWLNIPESALKNNASMDEYAVTYQNGIKSAEAYVTKLEEQLAKDKEEYAVKIKVEQDKLNKLESWISQITK